MDCGTKYLERGILESILCYLHREFQWYTVLLDKASAISFDLRVRN